MNKITTSTIIYTISNYLQAAFSIILVPLYTRYLSPEDYGIISILQSFIALLSILINFSLNGAASRYYYEGGKDYVKSLYGTITILIAINSVIVYLICFLLKQRIFILLGNIPIYPYFYLSLCTAIANPHIQIYKQKLQMEQNSIKYAIINIGNFLITMVLTILFVVYLKTNAIGVLRASLIANMITLLYICIVSVKEYSFRFSKHLARVSITYSKWLVPHNLASWSSQFMGKIFIANLSNLSNAGIYSVSERISSVLIVLVQSLNLATTPVVLKAYSEDNIDRVIKIASYMMVVIINVGLLISLFSKEIVKIFVAESYQSAWQLVPFLILGVVFNGFYMITSSFLFYNENATKYIFIITLISAVLNILMNIVLIPLMGNYGAALSTMTSYVTTNYITIFVANKFKKIDWEYKKIYLLLLFYILISLANYFNIISENNLVFVLAVKAGIYLIFLYLSLRLFKIKVLSLFQKSKNILA